VQTLVAGSTPERLSQAHRLTRADHDLPEADVARPPAPAAHADHAALARNPPREVHPPGAGRPDGLARRRLEVGAPVLPRAEGVGAEDERARNVAGHWSRPASGDGNAGQQHCAEQGERDYGERTHAATLSATARTHGRRASIVAKP